MPIVHVPTPLRPYTGERAEVEVKGNTVGEALEDLMKKHEGLANHLRDDSGNLRSFVNVYVGEEDIRFLKKEATEVDSSTEITIVPSIAGGHEGDALPELTKEEVSRYSRHLILPDVGMQGQRKLKQARVLCVGTGGLGSPLLLYLAAAGVGTIGIIDHDVVDDSNLQRQIIHGTSRVGTSKVTSARDRIRDLNPHVRVQTWEEPLSSENALEVIEPFDIVVDGTDNYPTRYLVNDACVLLDKPNVYGSIFRFEGQASVFNYQGGPNYRDLYSEPPPPGLVPSCAEGGVLGILPGLIGTIQATETVKIILGKGETLSGRLLLYDSLKMRFRELKLAKDPDREPITGLIDYEQFCGLPGQGDAVREDEAERGYALLSVGELQNRMEEGWDPYILDVRKPHEADIVRLSFADRLHPHESIADIASELPQDRDIVIHCKSGKRSAEAAGQLAELGFGRLYNLEGGIKAWAEEIDPALPTY